jgi:hypothetical protein
LAAHLAATVVRLATESDRHVYLHWCAERDGSPLGAGRSDVELFLRRLQEVTFSPG